MSFISSLTPLAAVDFQVGLAAIRVGQTLATEVPAFDIGPEHTCPSCDEALRAANDVFLLTEAASKEMEEARLLLVSDQALIDLRRRLRRGGHDKLGIMPVETGGEISDIAILLNLDQPQLADPKYKGTDMVLNLDPSFLTKLSLPEKVSLLEHELRHTLELQTHLAIIEVTRRLHKFQYPLSPVYPNLAMAIEHYFLRLHAWQEGRHDFVDRDIAMLLSRGLGAVGPLNVEEPWITSIVGSFLESASVYLAVGETAMVEETMRKVEGFLGDSIRRTSMMLWLSRRHEKLFEEGRRSVERLHRIISVFGERFPVDGDAFFEKLTAFAKDLEDRDMEEYRLRRILHL